jgi:hypothetical protein
MRKLQSVAKYTLFRPDEPDCWVFVVESPYEMTRSFGGVAMILGRRLEINEHLYDLVGVDVKCLNAPIRRGEHIGLLVMIPDGSG